MIGLLLLKEEFAMAVAEWTGAVIDWRAGLDDLKRLIEPAFGRSETRASAGAFLDGLLSSAERKTGWMLAEEAGFERPAAICPRQCT